MIAAGLTPEELAQPIEFEIVDEDGGGLNENDLIASFTLRLRPEEAVPGRRVLYSGFGRAAAILTVEIR